MLKSRFESELLLDENIFVYNDALEGSEFADELMYIRDNFCGRVINFSDFTYDFCTKFNSDGNKGLIYVYGDFNDIVEYKGMKGIDSWLMNDGVECYEIYDILRIVGGVSTNYNFKNFTTIGIGEVPLNVHGLGVFFPNFFGYVDDGDGEGNYFKKIANEHTFQDLTESNKKGMSYRKGIYITDVSKKKYKDEDIDGEDMNDEYHFKLLRCSTNLGGPTDNVRDTDNFIINKINSVAGNFYDKFGYDDSKLNHVLAQIYENKTLEGVEKKAKIKAHSDKTKDMPDNGLMAFCTFYNFDDVEGMGSIVKKRGYDYVYCEKTGTSILTKLRFRLKRCVDDDLVKSLGLVSKFDVTLYPNSVFLMSLLTNRYYTHEIVPSSMPIKHLPTRLGYVIRCSNTEAMYRDGKVYVKKNGVKRLEKMDRLDGIDSIDRMGGICGLDGDAYLPLIRVSEYGDEIDELKSKYYQENVGCLPVKYGFTDFSLNEGDYLCPLI